MKKIELIMPVMRPESALKVLQDLENQTKLIDSLFIIDNGGDFKLDKDYPFFIKILRPGHNIGTNAAWNHLFTSTADFVGVIGDDYELENCVIEGLIKAFNVFPKIGAATATIFKDRPIVPATYVVSLKGGAVIGKGHLGVAFFKKCTLDCLPEIPEELFIFYGDNWLGYWLNILGLPIFEINVGISHKHKLDLKKKLNYKSVIKQETNIWNAWKNGTIEL